MSHPTKTPADYKRSIAAYKCWQEIVNKVITQYGGKLHQKDFDKEFSDRIPPVTCYEDNTVILGEILDLRGWSLWLDLVQIMVAADMLTIEGKPPNVRYCLKQKNKKKK